LILLLSDAIGAGYVRHPTVDGGCRIIKYLRGSHQVTEHTFDAGQYCLGQDFIQRKGYDLIDGRDRGDPKQKGIISIGASDTELDLQGHLLSGTPYDNVLGINTWWSEPRDENGRLHLNKNPTQILGRLHVYNGRIEVKGSGAVGMDLAKPYANLTIHFNDKLSHDSVSKDANKIGILPEENTFEFKMERVERDARFWLESYPFGLPTTIPTLNM
jgi:hypothetical protein